MKRLLPWFAVLAILLVGFGTIYGAVNQAQRSDANDPQIQLAEDTANSLDKKETPLTLTRSGVEMTQSVAPFINVYDKKGKAVLTKGNVDGKAPKAPLEELEKARGVAYHAFTWEPKEDVRVAAIAVEAKDYYVLSGKSLREVEKNQTTTLQVVLLGAVVATLLLGVVFVLSGIVEEY